SAHHEVIPVKLDLGFLNSFTSFLHCSPHGSDSCVLLDVFQKNVNIIADAPLQFYPIRPDSLSASGPNPLTVNARVPPARIKVAFSYLAWTHPSSETSPSSPISIMGRARWQTACSSLPARRPRGRCR